ncbi:RluA family pseudouridine synthase [Alicyclobacillus shizuokensis]|uniref:RluA family pseudouridine synthase n=1 Tax=Alicyclobacillus shizuokensis TaxID=392014 RepID=UPI00082EA056|nr:RluA family pseudouridine synthase [Alicyclobacillus shizuokensis]
MNVQVQGDMLLIQPDRRALGSEVARLLTTALALPEGFVRTLFHQQRVLLGAVPATPTDLVGKSKLRLTGGVVEPYGVDDWGAVPMAEVLHADDHLFVVNKPPGILIHPGGAEDRDTLAHRVAHWLYAQGLERKVRHVHRLDEGTSGCVLYAAHAYAARALDRALAERRIERTYLALVHGRLPQRQGRIELRIGRDRHVAGKYRVTRSGKPASTEYWVLGEHSQRGHTFSLLECRLQTGRTHQIRVHLNHLGCPIVGDTLYGGHRVLGWRNESSGIALHAARLALPHPYTGEQVTVRVDLPASWQGVLQWFARTMAEMAGAKRGDDEWPSIPRGTARGIES